MMNNARNRLGNRFDRSQQLEIRALLALPQAQSDAIYKQLEFHRQEGNTQYIGMLEEILTYHGLPLSTESSTSAPLAAEPKAFGSPPATPTADVSGTSESTANSTAPVALATVAAKLYSSPVDLPEQIRMTSQVDGFVQDLFATRPMLTTGPSAEEGGEAEGRIHLIHGEIQLEEDTVTSNESINSVSYFPSDPTFLGIWHTHPVGNSFSPTDVTNFMERNSSAGQGIDIVWTSQGNRYMMVKTAITSPPSGSRQQRDAEIRQFNDQYADKGPNKFLHGLLDVAQQHGFALYASEPGSDLLYKVNAENITRFYRPDTK